MTPLSRALRLSCARYDARFGPAARLGPVSALASGALWAGGHATSIAPDTTGALGRRARLGPDRPSPPSGQHRPSPPAGVRDDPGSPDPGFAELYAQLPDATDLWPWLDWALKATPPVLYLGIGAGRLAVPLHAAGISMVGVDSHPGMLAQLHARLPGVELIRSRIEDLRLKRQFDLVMVPSNILYTSTRLRRAAAHVTASGRLALELANPHWLRAGAGPGVRIKRFGPAAAQLEIDYEVLSGQVYTQHATFKLVWPEQVEAWLERGGLVVHRILGWPDRELTASPTFYVLAGKVSRGVIRG